MNDETRSRRHRVHQEDAQHHDPPPIAQINQSGGRAAALETSNRLVRPMRRLRRHARRSSVASRLHAPRPRRPIDDARRRRWRSRTNAKLERRFGRRNRRSERTRIFAPRRRRRWRARGKSAALARPFTSEWIRRRRTPTRPSSASGRDGGKKTGDVRVRRAPRRRSSSRRASSLSGISARARREEGARGVRVRRRRRAPGKRSRRRPSSRTAQPAARRRRGRRRRAKTPVDATIRAPRNSPPRETSRDARASTPRARRGECRGGRAARGEKARRDVEASKREVDAWRRGATR